MAQKTTFIKLDRGIENWRWYKDANTFRVWIHLLINANIKDSGFMGMTIKRGELATSYQSIASHTNLTYDKVRTAISHLKSTGEVTVKSHSKFVVIAIPQYDFYQGSTQQLPSQVPTTSQSNPNQIPFTSQQSKNNKNNKNERNKENKGASAGFSLEAFADWIALGETQEEKE